MTDKTSRDLYRSIHKSTAGYDDGPIVDGKAVAGVLYPDFAPRRISATKSRPADVDTFMGTGGALMVRSGGGTSLFDKPYVLPGGTRNWHNFKIPEDTLIPDSLVVIFTGYNKAFNADHWQIESRAGSMVVDAMKGALDNLARNAIVRLVETGELVV